MGDEKTESGEGTSEETCVPEEWSIGQCEDPVSLATWHDDLISGLLTVHGNLPDPSQQTLPCSHYTVPTPFTTSHNCWVVSASSLSPQDPKIIEEGTMLLISTTPRTLRGAGI